MLKKRIDKAYRPLEMVYHIEVVGGVPAVQQYNNDLDEHIPDYELVPLILQPHIHAYDREGVVEGGEVTGLVANPKWTQIIPGQADVVITETQPNGAGGYPIYALETKGLHAGRLTVRKNFAGNSQATLRFECDYTDPRNSSVMHIAIDQAIQCTNATVAPPTMDVDCPETFVWNPWRDNASLTVNARLAHGTRTLTTGVTFYFEKKRPNGAWTVIGNTAAYSKAAYEDLGFSVSGSAFTQDMSLMGGRLDMRVRATYPSKPTLADDSPTKYFTLIRRLPDFEYDYGGVPEDVETFVKKVYPVLHVTDHDGLVTHPVANGSILGEVDAIWYTAAGVASGNPTMAEVAHGETPEISTSKINNNGMILAVDVVDRGPRKPVADRNGKYVTDISGKVVISR